MLLNINLLGEQGRGCGCWTRSEGASGTCGLTGAAAEREMEDASQPSFLLVLYTEPLSTSCHNTVHVSIDRETHSLKLSIFIVSVLYACSQSRDHSPAVHLDTCSSRHPPSSMTPALDVMNLPLVSIKIRTHLSAVPPLLPSIDVSIRR